MNIFITGGSGFIGKNLIEELSKNKQNKLYCLVRKTSNQKNIEFLKNFNVKLIYELDEKIINKCEIIYHLAGQLQIFNLPKKEYYKSNVILTKDLLSLCKNNQKLIFLSTTGIHGKCTNVNENSLFNPKNNYEITKLLAELEVKKYLNHIIIRPGLVYGKYNENLQGFYNSIKKRLFFIIGNGQNLIQPIDVKKLIFVLIEAKDKKIKNETFIIAGEKVSFENYYISLAKSFNVKYNKMKIPKFIAIIIVFFYQHIMKVLNIKPIVTIDGLKLLTETRTYNTSKSHKYFKFLNR